MWRPIEKLTFSRIHKGDGLAVSAIEIAVFVHISFLSSTWVRRQSRLSRHWSFQKQTSRAYTPVSLKPNHIRRISLASYALIKFKISNDFYEWEQAFYAAQPTARQARIIEFSTVDVTLTHKLASFCAMCTFEGSYGQFFAEAGEEVAKLGHILESAEVTMLNN